MSQENVEIVRRAFAAWERGDLEAVFGLVADDVTVYRADPDGATYHGKEGFLQATAEWTEDFAEWSVIPEEFIDAGDHVLVRVLQRARGEASGATVEGQFWFLFGVREGRISKLHFYLHESKAREASGLSE